MIEIKLGKVAIFNDVQWKDCGAVYRRCLVQAYS